MLESFGATSDAKVRFVKIRKAKAATVLKVKSIISVKSARVVKILIVMVMSFQGC